MTVISRRSARRCAARLAAAICVGAAAAPAVAAPAAHTAGGQGAQGGWTVVKLPEPQARVVVSNFTPAAIACPSASWCAGGGYFTVSEIPLEIATATIGWSGRKWTVTELPSSLSGVVDTMTCASPAVCFGGGSYGSRPPRPRLLTWNGQSWRAAQAPLPAGAMTNASGTVTGLSCPSRSWCAGVGDYASGSSTLGFWLTWSGGKWKASAAPAPLSAVSCPTTSLCVAAATGPTSQPLIYTWSAGTWTKTALRLPSGTSTVPQVDEVAISCPSTTVCAVGGRYSSSAGTEQGLLLTGVGGKWLVRREPVPAGAASDGWSDVPAVSCPSATSCTATGHYVDGHNGLRSIFLTWALGKGWKVSASPGPDITAISCPTITRCFAVGSQSGPVALIGP